MRIFGSPLGSHSEHRQVKFMLKITSAKKVIFWKHGGGAADRLGVAAGLVHGRNHCIGWIGLLKS